FDGPFERGRHLQTPFIDDFLPVDGQANAVVRRGAENVAAGLWREDLAFPADAEIFAAEIGQVVVHVVDAVFDRSPDKLLEIGAAIIFGNQSRRVGSFGTPSRRANQYGRNFLLRIANVYRALFQNH